jgi:ribosome biogenesis GTPase
MSARLTDEERERLERRHAATVAHRKDPETAKLERRAAKLRAGAEPPAPPRVRSEVEPGLAAEDWESDELDALPKRERLGRRKSESLDKLVERLRAEGEEASREAVTEELLAESGLVVSITRGQCEVEIDGHTLVCHLPKALALTQQSELAVGDRVRVARRPGGALAVAQILPRGSRLSRPDPFLAHRERVVAANVDLAVVVASLARPPLSTGLLDRYLVALAHGQVPALLAINKVDLTTGPREADPELVQLAPYRALEVPIVFCSTRTGEGIAELAAWLAGKTAVFVGHSGVGKSSLLNALAPGLDAAVGEVSAGLPKGRHTTSRSRIYRLDDGTRIIDTPGIREFGLWRMTARELAGYFDEFEPRAAACKFADCTHSHEPRCAVREAAAAGAISAERYATYLRILASLGG